MPPTADPLVTTTASTVPELLAECARVHPGAPAVLAPGRTVLSYQQLKHQLDEAAAVLVAAGVGAGDRVALLVREGPEAATAFLSAARVGAAAPLNPAYRAEELEFYLRDLRPRVLVVSAGLATAAREVARAAGIAVLELLPLEAEGAGRFRLEAVGVEDSAAGGEGRCGRAAVAADDVALVLHTSGTTSRPKQVPLSHANLLASATHIAHTLQLRPADRCLNIMPLFHIHGLGAAVLASLRAGASVACTPGLRPGCFFGWLAELAPTWYTAVPTLHQAILAEAAARGVVSPGPAADGPWHHLRLVRSCSSALPRRTLDELERLFGVPVLEAYGMTEAAHQMASNPLPPGGRKPGSVGRAAGPEVAIMDGSGRLLPPGLTGEVVIRGRNVTRGYVANPEANAAAFVEGWFRTGDQGYLDDEGYLFLTGRLKELINRGGEKISPVEVDEALMAHPAVQQAVSFGVPHPALGEEVGAAVVLRSGAALSERGLREFAAARLAYHKVPRRVVFLDSIPKGATGKVQRVGLARRLGLDVPEARAADDVGGPPRTPVEEIVAALWQDVLRAAPAGVHEDFFRAGGDSIRGAELVARLRETLRIDLSLLAFFDVPTVAGLAEAAESLLAAEAGALP